MTALDLAIAGLALWRVSALMAYEQGPWQIFMRLRRRAGVEMYDSGEPTISPQEGYLAQLLSCIWCLSMMLAIPYAAVYMLLPAQVRVASLPFAISALAILVEKVNRG
jgi:hypothetical protein